MRVEKSAAGHRQRAAFVVDLEISTGVDVRWGCAGDVSTEPIHGDESISRVLAETRRYEEISRTGKPLLVTAAYDGMEIRL